MLEITATEFKLNFGYYLNMVSKEEIWVTKNGKYVAKIVNPNVSSVDSISGILKGKVPVDITDGDLREERLLKYESND